MASAKGGEQDFAAKMQRLRKKGGVSLDALSKATGISAEYLGKIETGEIRPPVSNIIQISNALVVDSGKFLSAADDQPTKKQTAESYKKRKNAYYYKTLSHDAEHKHMKAFHITIPPESDHEMVEYRHAGEEFIYVLDGRLDLHVGAKKNNLKKGQTMHFDSGNVHKLSNPGKKTTELIVVVYTP
jgi:uncharacterized cupin superfamily protein